MSEEDRLDNGDDGQDEQYEQYDDQDDDQPPGSGPYYTLHTEGPEQSAGSVGHPDACMPCTFYCFTRRGCNRGPDCRFCHLLHQSKLQQRRESWKKQQREKRKSIRERVAAEALTRRHPPSSGGGGNGGHLNAPMPMPGGNGGSNKNPSFDFVEPPQNARAFEPPQNARAFVEPPQNARAFVEPPQNARAYGLPKGGRGSGKGGSGDAIGSTFAERQPPGGKGGFRADAAVVSMASSIIADACDMAADAGPQRASTFAYNELRTILTIGQECEFVPQLFTKQPVQFRLVAPLPQGLALNQTSGVITGAPEVRTPQKLVVVEADFPSGPPVQATIEMEVVDFTRGGFVVGHVSEVSPGKFMLLMHVPDEKSSVAPEQGGSCLPWQSSVLGMTEVN